LLLFKKGDWKMSKIILLTVIFLLPNNPILSKDQPEDGFYLLALDNNVSQEYQSQDGTKFSLGEKQTLNIQGCEITSSNNENTQFYLSVGMPYDDKVHSSWNVLFVEGTSYRQSISFSSKNETMSKGFKISGEENAKQVSKYLNTPIQYRKHPQHNLLVTFTPTKEEFIIGDEVTATLRIKNVGDKAFKFQKGGRNRALRDNQYIFTAYFGGSQVSDIGTNNHLGGLAVTCIIKPEEVFEDKISLSKWFSFNEAGTYDIHGSYYLDFQDAVINHYRTIWQDYASADFTVKIKENNR
jgi:hypothetical protein